MTSNENLTYNEVGMDNLGRTSIEVEEYYTCLHKTKPFWDYISDRYSSNDDFKRLKPNEKEKILLRWKWGSDNDDSNKDCEITRKAIMKDINLDHLPEHSKQYYTLITNFEDVCDRIRHQCGLGMTDGVQHIPEVKDLLTHFDGKVKGWE